MTQSDKRRPALRKWALKLAIFAVAFVSGMMLARATGAAVPEPSLPAPQQGECCTVVIAAMPPLA